MESKYSKFLTILLIIIVVGIVGLLGYMGYSYFKGNKDDQEAQEYVQAFANSTDDNTSNNNQTKNSVSSNDIDIEDVSGNGSTKKKKMYKGFYVSGTIEIPKTGLSCPVLEKPTRKALETSVATLWPKDAVLNSKGNVVIVGHNYRNGRFFSNNKKISNGDKIYITDLDGKKITYIVYKTFEAAEDDTSFYNRDTNGAREITLSTCTDDSKARTIVLAKESN